MANSHCTGFVWRVIREYNDIYGTEFYLSIVEGVKETVGNIKSVTSVTVLSYKGVTGNLKSR